MEEIPWVFTGQPIAAPLRQPPLQWESKVDNDEMLSPSSPFPVRGFQSATADCSTSLGLGGLTVMRVADARPSDGEVMALDA